jgi:hypothetical protein
MKRKAVLIESSDVSGCNDLPGARVDVENWITFLRSDLGGAWKDAEIVTLRKPFTTQVEREVGVARDCYCFVAFSGHGCEGSVVLNDSVDSFPIAKLKPTGGRGTVVVDACRGIAEGRIYNFANQSLASIALNAKSGETMELFESRTANVKAAAAVSEAFRNWVAVLENSAHGTVEMLSCAKGQSAQENPASGGFYTSLLLRSAERWSQRTTNEKVHTTKNAHDYAANNLPPQQTPEYSPIGLAFPFAAKS